MQRNLLFILMSMVLLSPLAIDIYLPSLPTMAQDFSVSNSQVQSTLILFLFAMGLGQVIIGPLADSIWPSPGCFVWSGFVYPKQFIGGGIKRV